MRNIGYLIFFGIISAVSLCCVIISGRDTKRHYDSIERDSLRDERHREIQRKKDGTDTREYERWYFQR